LLKTQFIRILIILCLTSFKTSAQKDDPVTQVTFMGRDFRIPKAVLQHPATLRHDIQATQAIDKFLSERTSDLLKDMDIARKEMSLCDWLYYQLIRKVSNAIAPKLSDYFQYTSVKFHLLSGSGYDPLLVVDAKRTLLYIRTNDIIYNLPAKLIGDRQYICINHHDYGFDAELPGSNAPMLPNVADDSRMFSFVIDRLPDFPETDYMTREIEFDYGRKKEHLSIRLNKTMRGFFANYPVTEYGNQFNIPVSRVTSESLVNALKPKLAGLSQRNGLEYLLHFTRHAFLFAKDSDIFGREKRFSAEETLLYEKSDCEDRSALFFWLVKQTYDLPMIVLSFPDHVTVAVELGESGGHTVDYNGNAYTICEPTPQKKELRIGQTIPKLHDRPFEVHYVYTPKKVK